MSARDRSFTELFGEEAEELRKRGGDAGEYGATTGRPRRVGWFDAVATRYGCKVHGATECVLTNLDVLAYLDEILCLHGLRGGRRDLYAVSVNAQAHALQTRVHRAARMENGYPRRDGL